MAITGTASTDERGSGSAGAVAGSKSSEKRDKFSPNHTALSTMKLTASAAAVSGAPALQRPRWIARFCPLRSERRSQAAAVLFCMREWPGRWGYGHASP